MGEGCWLTRPQTAVPDCAFVRLPISCGTDMDIVLRRPDPARRDEEADGAMAVQRTTLQATLPGLPHPHTEEEDRAWMRDNFARCSVWLAVDGDRIVGVATRSGALVRQ